MYLELQKRLSEHLRSVLKLKYDLDLTAIPMEIPPDLKFGELSTPIAFELARKLRKAPKAIAAEIVAALGTPSGFASFEVAGAGYINARFNRASAVAAIAAPPVAAVSGAHVLVEHTSINPNKAAHIGHLRNAILGDTFVRLLRAAGQKVDVQNYIDNTGVQVADVVVGFLHIEKKSLAEVRAIVAEREQRSQGPAGHVAAIDYLCWDLYARTSQWYEQGSEEEKATRKQLRYATLHEIEEGNNETADVAELISTSVLRRHLETMMRLDIEYDFLPRESEILHLHFWDAAFDLMKQSGVLYFETEGKNKGCWVMTRPGADVTEGELDEDAKVIVRSNGTVTYVGKDIAYHLWKFGLLGKDFGYKPFFTYPDHECWISTVHGKETHPQFGGAQAIYNVIDVRQNDPQANLVQALRGMGFIDQADHCIHFGYEKVALTPRCALDMGYEVEQKDLDSPYILVSGRKGFGVKADDLIDKLIAATQILVDERQAERSMDERRTIATQIAVGALRFFMLKFTRNTVIAFDFKDALSFEGETGPYIQYAVVRIRRIFENAGLTPEDALSAFAGIDPAPFIVGDENLVIWSLLLRAGRRSMVLDQCIATSEPAHLARHAFQLAQEFAGFYHDHHILTEPEPARKSFLLAVAAIALRELTLALSWLGIESPQAM